MHLNDVDEMMRVAASMNWTLNVESTLGAGWVVTLDRPTGSFRQIGGELETMLNAVRDIICRAYHREHG